jgi:hypothetical protein
VEEKIMEKLNYLKTKKVPIFEGYLAKQANHWKAFRSTRSQKMPRHYQKRTRKMSARRNITTRWGQGATRRPSQSGIRKSKR